eukprot:1009186-Pelagomonas_calceolata.AAC.3
MLDVNSNTLHQVLEADLHRVHQQGDEDMFKQRMLSASKIPMQDFMGDLRYRQQKVRREADSPNPREMSRKGMTNLVMVEPSNQTARTPFCIPSYLSKDLDKGVMRNVSRLRLRAHCLKVESCEWLGGSNFCDQCERAESKTINMLFSITIALRCVSCAEITEIFVLAFQAFAYFCPASKHSIYSFLSELTQYN